MSGTDQNRPNTKPAQRNRKAERGRKPDQQKSLKPDQLLDTPEQTRVTHTPSDTAAIDAPAFAETAEIGATVAPAETVPNDAAVADAAEIGPTIAATEIALIGATPVTANVRATAPIGLQVIANAYGEYIWKSLGETRSFMEKLRRARSLEQAIELQAEFARQAYENFVADSREMFELYTEVASQIIFKPLENFAAKRTSARR